MPDPKTISLGPDEWRALVDGGLRSAVAFLASGSPIEQQDIAGLHAHLDRVKAFTAAWHAALVQKQVESQTAAVAVPEPEKHASNGNGAAPRRKGGWPKGKSRKAAQAVMQ